MKQVILACLLIGFVFSAKANNDLSYVTDVFFEQNGAYIDVHYQVPEGPATQRLLVKLTFNINGDFVKPKTTSLVGHFGGVKMDGQKKKITWNAKDTFKKNLTGQITPIISYEVLEFGKATSKVIDFSPSGLGTLVLPAIGHKKMDRSNTMSKLLNIGQILGLTTGVGILVYGKAVYNKKYKEAVYVGSNETVEGFYDNAEQLRKLGNGLLFVGIGSWATNTLYLIFRGKTNQQKLKDFDKKYQWGLNLKEEGVMGSIQWTINKAP